MIPSCIQLCCGLALRNSPMHWPCPPSLAIIQMTARVLESLEDKDGAAFAAACESLWGNESPSVSSTETDPMPALEVSVIVFNHGWYIVSWHIIAVIFAKLRRVFCFCFCHTRLMKYRWVLLTTPVYNSHCSVKWSRARCRYLLVPNLKPVATCPSPH